MSGKPKSFKSALTKKWSLSCAGSVYKVWDFVTGDWGSFGFSQWSRPWKHHGSEEYYNSKPQMLCLVLSEGGEMSHWRFTQDKLVS